VALLWRQGIGNKVMQADKMISQSYRAQGGFWMAVDESIGIGASDGDDERASRTLFGKSRNGIGTAPGVYASIMSAC